MRQFELTGKSFALATFGAFVVFSIYSGTRQLPNEPGYLQAAYFFGRLIRDVIESALAGISIWLISLAGEKLRLRKRRKIAFQIGAILYWIGCALGILVLLFTTRDTLGAINAHKLGFSLVSTIFYSTYLACLFWLAGRGARYMLQGEDADANASSPT